MPRNTSGLKRGGPGRTKGSKDAVPRSFKASIRAVFEDLLSKDPKILQAAVLRGLSSRKPKEAFLYVRLFADLTGELKHQIELTGKDGAPLNLRGLTDAELATVEALAEKCRPV